MLDISLLGQVLQITWPSLLGISVTGVAWLISFRLARERDSSGLFLISIGLLVNFLVGVSWYAVYWFVLGGPFQFFTLDKQGLSVAQIGELLALENLVGDVLSLGAWVVTLSLIIYGAMRLTASQTPLASILVEGPHAGKSQVPSFPQET